MNGQTIAVVDDDKEIARLLRGYLEQAGFRVVTAYSAATALHMVRSDQPQLLLLDLGLPDGDGWDITRRLRADARTADLPIVMLTARIEDSDKIIGLELGADDYITKPFNPREVVARVRALLRRAQRSGSSGARSILTVGGLVMNVAEHSVLLDGQPLDLTPTEFSLLRVLMENPAIAFTRDELIEQGLGYTYAGLGRTLDSHIKNIRRKLGDDPAAPAYIQTIYGIGYRLVDPNEDFA